MNTKEFYNNSHYSYEDFINLTPTGITTNFETVFEIMEAYAKSLLPSDEEIKELIPDNGKGHSLLYDRMKRIGAKIAVDHIKKQIG